jgi:hypothetical protein
MLPPSSQIDIRRQYLFQSVLPHQVNIDRDERRVKEEGSQGAKENGLNEGQKVAQQHISAPPNR